MLSKLQFKLESCGRLQARLQYIVQRHYKIFHRLKALLDLVNGVLSITILEIFEVRDISSSPIEPTPDVDSSSKALTELMKQIGHLSNIMEGSLQLEIAGGALVLLIPVVRLHLEDFLICNII